MGDRHEGGVLNIYNRLTLPSPCLGTPCIILWSSRPLRLATVGRNRRERERGDWLSVSFSLTCLASAEISLRDEGNPDRGGRARDRA